MADRTRNTLSPEALAERERDLANMRARQARRGSPAARLQLQRDLAASAAATAQASSREGR